MTKKYFFSKLFFWHFLPAERTKAWEGMVSESQKQFYMVNSELLSKMYCVLPNFAHKLRNEIGLFRSDIPMVLLYIRNYSLKKIQWNGKDYNYNDFFVDQIRDNFVVTFRDEEEPDNFHQPLVKCFYVILSTCEKFVKLTSNTVPRGL